MVVAKRKCEFVSLKRKRITKKNYLKNKYHSCLVRTIKEKLQSILQEILWPFNTQSTTSFYHIFHEMEHF